MILAQLFVMELILYIQYTTLLPSDPELYQIGLNLNEPKHVGLSLSALQLSLASSYFY